MEPKFSAYPFDRLARRTRRQAALESAIARWIALAPAPGRLEQLVRGTVTAHVVGLAERMDPDAARCEVRVKGVSLEVLGSARAVRTLAQALLGGPDELAAPRPLGAVEHAVWALVVAAAVEDLGVPGDVWPCSEPVAIADPVRIELAVTLAGTPAAVVLRAPRALELRAPAGEPPAWAATTLIDVPVILGRCAIPRGAAAALAVRQVITLEPASELLIDLGLGAAGAGLGAAGAVGVRIASGAVVGEVTSGYVRRDMSLPDDAHVELTVALGTTQLSLRQVFELSVGQIVPLGRPLAGPFEVRAAGKLVGRGELVDVDGELGVRIVSVGES